MREEIITTSLQRFLKYGIRRMTIQRLVAPLGISTKTVYKYFANKQELLKNCLVIHYSKLLDETQLSESGFPNAVIAIQNMWESAINTDFGINRVFYQDLNHYYPALQDEILKKYSSRISGSVIRQIEQGIHEGFFRKDLQAAIVFETMTILYTSITRSGQYKKFKLPPIELIRQTLMVYLRGILTEKGLKELK